MAGVRREGAFPNMVLPGLDGGSHPLSEAWSSGEALFLDGRRSHERWMSCASCHGAGHTNGLNFDTRGDGGYGAPKNTPSLLGVAGTEPMAWNGMFSRLSEQVRQSVESSLHGPSPSPGQVDDLVAYLQTLDPPPPRRGSDEPSAVRAACWRSPPGSCSTPSAPPRSPSAWP